MIVRESARIGSLRRLDLLSFPHDDLGPLPFPYDQPDIGNLDSILSKAISRISVKTKKVVKKIVPKSIATAITKAAKSVRAVVKKAATPAMKGFKKYFPKVAPFLAIAVQVFNVIPGLGVALGVAISVGSAALTTHQNLVAMKKAGKLAKEEEAAMDAEAADLDRQANESLDSTYNTGESLFASEYGMPRDQWSALSVEGKTKFLKEAVALANQKKFAAVGVTPKQFSEMTEEESERALEEAFGIPTWGWVAIAGGGVLLVVGLAFLLKSKKASA